jgi:acyl carrier protein
MLAVEEAFGVEIPGSLITHDMFASIAALAGVIAQLVPEESIATRS